MAATGILLDGVGEFVVLAGGGVLVGAVVAAGVIVVRRRITDPVLETVAALVTPYAAYLLGETFHVSGVTAVIVAGLVIGAWHSRITTAQTRLHLRRCTRPSSSCWRASSSASSGCSCPSWSARPGIRAGSWRRSL